MCSIPKSLLLSTFALVFVAGCQFKQADQPIVNTEPMSIDQAMQKRDWDVSTAYYQNGSVPSWADRFTMEASDSTVETWGWATETPLFVANVVVWPFTYIGSHWGATVNQPSVQTEPTYTAMVPTAESAVYFNNSPPAVEPTH